MVGFVRSGAKNEKNRTSKNRRGEPGGEVLINSDRCLRRYPCMCLLVAFVPTGLVPTYG
jgi:hypothetical protein